jgi:predicted dehydrogenase
MSQIPVAVIGTGRMGQHHARVMSEMPGAKLVAVVDQDAAKARTLAEKYGCQSFADVPSLLAANLGLRGAVVAVPTIYHRGVAELLLNAGVDVLIEKPMAPSVADCDALLALARAKGRIIQIGHTERFNPVMQALKAYPLSPRFIEVHRISPMTFRSIDIGVVLDMMIHDIDIVAHLVAQPVTEVHAVGVSVLGVPEDVCNARLTFANGCVANITASRLAMKTERKMRLFSPNAYVSVDYAKKAGVVITKTGNQAQLDEIREKLESGEVADLSQLDYTKLVRYEELTAGTGEPLKLQADNFLTCIATRGIPEVSGADGRTNVDIATRICAAVATHQWSDVPGNRV